MDYPKRSLTQLAGFIWAVTGVLLLVKGLRLLIESSQFGAHTSALMQKLSPIAGGSEGAALLLVSIALFIGFVKGRVILARSAKRTMDHLVAVGKNAGLKDLFTVRYIAIIALMMLLGRAMNWLNLESDLRGTIDVAVGAALIHGSMAFFRTLIDEKEALKNQ